MENGWKVYFKTVTGEETYTILQNQSLELATTVIIISVVIDGFSGEGLMIGSHNCPITSVRFYPTVRLQLFRLIGHIRYINISEAFRSKSQFFLVSCVPRFPKEI